MEHPIEIVRSMTCVRLIFEIAVAVAESLSGRIEHGAFGRLQGYTID